MQLYNVLVVDDEPYIANSIASLLGFQEDLNFSISIAGSGEDAMRIMEGQRIDILISDIEMKGLSGIELAKAVHDRWPLCRSILITAYDNFEYIYEAGRIGVESYILKTEKDEHIISEVKRVVSLIEKELRDSRWEKGQIAQLQETVNFAKKDLFFSFLKNTNDFSGEEQRQTMEILGFEEPFRNLYLVCGKLLDFGDFRNPGNLKRLSAAICQIKMTMSSFITSRAERCACEDKYDMIYWILQKDGTGSGQTDMAWLSGMMETVQEVCLTTMDMGVSFILCSCAGIQQLPGAYQRCRMIMRQEGLGQNPGVYSFQWKPAEPVGMAAYNIDILCAQLRKHLEGGEFVRFSELISEICGRLGSFEKLTDRKFRQLYFSIALFLIQMVESRRLGEDMGKNICIDSLLFPDSFDNPDSAADYLGRVADTLTELIPVTEEKILEGIVERMQEHIRHHLSEDISLQNLSDYFGYNVSYLSRLFHKKVGIRLGDYVAQCRMEEIRRLMKFSDLSIAEIMEQTGFHSRSYFNRFVKHMTGMTPQKLCGEILDGGECFYAEGK